jgi:hypothetical protein
MPQHGEEKFKIPVIYYFLIVTFIGFIIWESSDIILQFRLNGFQILDA